LLLLVPALLFADEAEGFFFFFLAAVELVEAVWPDAAGSPDAAGGATAMEAARMAARLSAAMYRPGVEREFGEVCTLIYPL
jgi:hypothetical protein